MKRTVGISLILSIAGALLASYLWPFANEIRHYTEAELVGLTCAELSEKHEEVIVAYHDASIAHYRKTGAFEDDLGLPEEGVLPFVIVMKKVIRDSNFAGLDLNMPFFYSASAATPRLHSDLFSEVSGICATYPAMNAIAAVLQAAEKLELTQAPANSE